MKPSPEFFKAICTKLGMRPQEIVFVGDDRENDYQASRTAGMHAVLVDRKRRHIGVNSVSNLIELLGNSQDTPSRSQAPAWD